ncbi:MAG: M20/M25/M40 family metallo-hydrolase [Bacteriovoracaceae bacterium]|nr:M20/M25/M40 family metallo-hydrolase [Bacteriovoracaceae bacterium]
MNISFNKYLVIFIISITTSISTAFGYAEDSLWHLYGVDYKITQQDQVKSWIEQVSEPHIANTIKHLTSYRTRYYKAPEGVEAMKWIASSWRSLLTKRSDVKVELYDHKIFPQPSVILTIQGDSNDLIILGGHGDSINTNDEGVHSVAPGADDNAAGIGVLTEIIRLFGLNNYRPKHTIQFIAYASEEHRIHGSYDLSDVYDKAGKSVIGVIQFDGVNYKGPSYDMVLVSDYTHKDQNEFLGRLIDTYLDISWTYDPCGYGCSDHAAWTYEGYRASFPFESLLAEENPYIHTAEDTFDKSGNNANHATLFAKLGVAYLLELDQ